MGNRTKMSSSEKREVVMMLLRREESAGKLARRYGISEGTLYRWRDIFLEGGKEALSNGKKGANSEKARIMDLQKEIEKREQVIGEITIANRILKKTWTAPSEFGSEEGYRRGVRRIRENASYGGFETFGDIFFQLVSSPTGRRGAETARTCSEGGSQGSGRGSD